MQATQRHTFRPRRQVLAGLALLAALGSVGCAALSPREAWIETELVFGMNIGMTQGVDEAEWQDFLVREVTPRFPEGLTVIAAAGQWRSDASASIVREPSRILRILHRRDARSDAKLSEIARAYATQFEQDAVMRIDREVAVRFE